MTFTLAPDFLLLLAINLALIGAAWGTLRAQVQTLVEKAKDHDGLREALIKLTTEVAHLQRSLETQPQVIGSVVSETIKATLQFVRSKAAA